MAKKSKKNIYLGIDLENVSPSRARILGLIVAIIFLETFLVVSQNLKTEKVNNAPVVVQVKQNKNAALEREIEQMVKGYPIEDMTPYIASYDREVAAFLVGIAKKESNWGKRKPVLAGEDCYNYWGFRMKAERMGSGGHTCFDNPKEAVDAVASRIDQMVKEENLDSPKKMVVWKCGYNCTHPTASVKKWEQDVDYYYSQLVN
jgi:hypothetical protein